MAHDRTGGLRVTATSFLVPTTLSSWELQCDTTSRKTQVFPRGGMVVVHASADCWMHAGLAPVAVAPAAPGAPGDYTNGAAGGVYLPAGNQVPVMIGPGQALAFITRTGTATVSYSYMDNG